MAQVKEVSVAFRVGGKVQVKKFEIQSDYQYQAGVTLALSEDDDFIEVIDEHVNTLKELLEEKAQEDFETLWDQRLSNETKGKNAS